MAIIHWDPFADLHSLHSQVDDTFNQMFRARGSDSAPATDVYTEDDKKMVVETHLPNFEEKDIEVNIHQNVLEIRAEHHEKEEDKAKRKYLVRESNSSFYRRLALPERADDEAIKASFKNGLLKISIPFKELPAPKKVAIEASKKSSTEKPKK